MKKAVEVWKKIEEIFLIACICIMGIVLFLQIIMRFVFSSPFQWAEELARYLQIWITFIGIGYGIRKQAHIGMTLVKEKLPPLLGKVAAVFCDFAGIFTFIILLKSSLVFLEHQNVVSTAMRIPMRLVYIVIPVSAVLCIIYMLLEAVKNIISLAKKGDK